MMKKMWKNRSGVSPVIATILMVAITVVLAAVLYVMVMGFGGPSNTPPTGTFTTANKVDTKTMTFTFGTLSKDTKFTDCKITIKDSSGQSTAVDLAASGSVTVGSYSVKITDLATDGKISNGDYLTISPTSTTATLSGDYTVSLIWAQDGSQICAKTLTI